MSQGSLNTGIRPAPSRMANLTLAPVPDLAGDIPPDLLAMKTFVGAGGFGDVYRLEHPVRGVLAIKQIKESGTAAAIERQRRVSGGSAAQDSPLKTNLALSTLVRKQQYGMGLIIAMF